MKLNTRMPEKAIKPHRMELVLPDRLIDAMLNQDKIDALSRKIDALVEAKQQEPVVIEKEKIVHAEPIVKYIPRAPVRGEDFVLQVDRGVLGHIETVTARRPGDTSAFYIFHIERNFNGGVEEIRALAQ